MSIKQLRLGTLTRLFRRPGQVLTPRRDRRLSLLRLEERAVPATFTVSNVYDAGAGSLRDGIFQANATPGADTITFSPLFGVAQVITLTTGDLPISDDVTIAGPGAKLLTISGNNASDIFYVDAPAAAAAINISGMTLTAGKSNNGGAISSA